MKTTSKNALADPAKKRILLLAFSIFWLGGCAATNVQQIDRLESIGENPRILLMPPDIKYYLLTAGGVPEPNAEWTEAAQQNFGEAVSNYATSIGTNLKLVDKRNLSPVEIQYEELHAAVGFTIINNYFGYSKLPSKNGRFDWSLGPEIREIGEQHDADYALFVHYRDYQASGGRVAFAILAAAAGGAASIGSESGFASLVDLRTGDIVWFNVVTAGSGELRKKEGAATAVAALFKDIPTNTAPEE
ncbi:MAG: hypothetical protein OEW68_01055 [Gammaproteobacteria bacterium]|nr:hypothetical protein [Gammaproteobacteria bacterium]MDH4313411.1 hypothetical protein [Gammaproteobacteria bacterium]MDH5214068.1 hypothetical protein [Gammaproteobacteria bacterium]